MMNSFLESHMMVNTLLLAVMINQHTWLILARLLIVQFSVSTLQSEVLLLEKFKFTTRKSN